MSGSRKALKVISIILIVFAALLVLLGVVLSMGFAFLGDSSTAAAGVVAGAMGVVVIVTGIVYLIIGMLGVRGANNPSKIMPFFVLCIIGVVLNLIGLISEIVQGTFTGTQLIGFAIIVACLILAYNVRKENAANL